MPVRAWRDIGQNGRPQRDLIQGARNLYTTSPWSDPADLEKRVRRRLGDLAAEELAPWVRVGRALFRAREITNNGSTISIAAEVRSDAIHAELVRHRDQRAHDVPFASPHDAGLVQVAELSTHTTSTINHEEHLVLTVQERRSSNMPVSLNGVPAEEVTRRALSDGLFGTSMLGEQAKWITGAIDPLAPLRGMTLNDSVLRPVARLLFVERLITDEAAATIDSFVLGPSHQGNRRLRATWTPPRIYVNTPDPAPVSIDGTVRGL